MLLCVVGHFNDGTAVMVFRSSISTVVDVGKMRGGSNTCQRCYTQLDDMTVG